jgi:hypothetical protein
MTMSWLPFPFPECPYCGRTWAYSYHHDCPHGSQVEVEPHLRLIRCESCQEDWGIQENKFICACGSMFGEADAQAAVDDIVAATRLLAAVVEGNQQEVVRARQLGEGSLRLWIQGIATEMGGSIGGLLGTIAGSLVRVLFD